MHGLNRILIEIDPFLGRFLHVPPSLFFKPTPGTQGDIDELVTDRGKPIQDRLRHLSR